MNETGVSKILVAVMLLMGSLGLQTEVAMAKEIDETTTTDTTSVSNEVYAISQPVSAFFPDDNLAAEIAEELDLEGIVPNCTVNTVVTDAQLGMIESLDAQDANIFVLEGMQYLTGANSIDLAYNYIEVLTPLANLTNLTFLNLHNNLIEEITPLAGLVNLETLILDYNQIISLIPLSNLTNLTYLGLSANRISNVEPISNLTNLSSLYLNDNAITDISSLEAVLSDITYCNFEAQNVTLAPGNVGFSTYVVLENTDGSAPEITYTVGQGTYNENTEQLTWSTAGNNQLLWSATIPGTDFVFSGVLEQRIR